MHDEGGRPHRDIPQPGGTPGMWGSDAVADVLRSLEIPYLALNPGASFRGLGCEAIGPVQSAGHIASAIATAMQRVRAGAACVVDLRVEY